MSTLSFAVCTFNRAARLPALLAAMRRQRCPLDYEVLVVNNNSRDATGDVLAREAARPGPPVRVVTETTQGIVAARNRAIAESLGSDYLVFIDDDELPCSGHLEAAVRALRDEGAECVGGRIRVAFDDAPRPAWLSGALLGFLGELDYGDQPFWIQDRSTPVWSGNVGYRTAVFRADPGLRFDTRYDRAGHGIGGGSDAIMFRRLLDAGVRLRYEPHMEIQHLVEPWRLTRRYFLRLHYRAGVRYGCYEMPDYPRSVRGIAPFMLRNWLVSVGRAIGARLQNDPDYVRVAMNAAHATGCLRGRLARAGADKNTGTINRT